jgi:replicative DNA helicase
MAASNTKQMNGQQRSSTKQKKDVDFSVYGKVQPQAREVEDAVLGAIMLEKSVIDTILPILTKESFYSEANQMVYAAMQRLAQRSQPIDVLTVVEQLRANDELEKVGGAHYVTGLTNKVVSTANIHAHARIVLQKFLQRRLIQVCGQMINDAYEDSEDVFDLLDRAEENICAIGRDNIQGDTLSIDQVLVKVIGQIEDHRKQDSSVTGIATGFPSLNRVTRGWQNGDLIYIGARPSVGKTAVALKIANTAAKEGIPVAIKSLEMKAVRLILRMLSAESGIILHKIQTGRLDDEEMKQLYKTGIQPLSGRKIFFDDHPTRSLIDFKSWVRRLVKKYGVRLVVVDYLQLMRGGNEKQNREQEIAAISRELKVLAMEVNIPIVALSQLSREVEKRKEKRPMLSDLRESGSIEQDADVVLFIWDPEEDNEPGKRKLTVAKQRDGMLLTIDVDFKTEVQQMEEVENYAIKNPQLPVGNWKAMKDVPDFTEATKKTIGE